MDKIITGPCHNTVPGPYISTYASMYPFFFLWSFFRLFGICSEAPPGAIGSRVDVESNRGRIYRVSIFRQPSFLENRDDHSLGLRSRHAYGACQGRHATPDEHEAANWCSSIYSSRQKGIAGNATADKCCGSSSLIY